MGEDTIMKFRMRYFHVAMTLCLGIVCLHAQKILSSKRPSTAKVRVVQPNVLMNGNNVTSWVRSDGFFPALVQQSWNGEFPKGSGVGTIYQEGIVFGGLVDDGLYLNSLRITGDTYYYGMQPGALNADGTTNPADTGSLSARAFGVRSDMTSSIANTPAKWPDLNSDVASVFMESVNSVTSDQKSQVASQYFSDWNEWPATKGAPWFIDSIKLVRHDPSYDPSNPHHIPGIPGASKTVWFVCNDESQAVTAQFAGSPPIGMEEQVTLWCYASSTPLNNIIFKQVKLIYKGNPGAPANSSIDSLYIAQWSDPDVGDSGDDFAGSDSMLSLSYVYNSKNVDSKYLAAGLTPPAVGFTFVQGVSHYTGISADSAMVDFQWRHGYAYWFQRPLTASIYQWPSSAIEDPYPGYYSATQQWFNMMRGDLPRPAYPAAIPYWSSSPYAMSHNIETNFLLPGDPITGQGWVDGYDVQANDRRIFAVHGPMTLNLHDTAEVVIALANGMGADNLSSVRMLKSGASYAKAYYNQLPFNAMPPKVTYSINYGSPCTVSFLADARGINAKAIVIYLKTYNGVLVGVDTLSDDGLHDDGLPHDMLFGGSIQIPQQELGLKAEANVEYQDGNSASWPGVSDNITTTGPLSIVSPIVVSDNLNSDGVANPGENVRFTFTLINNSTVDLHHLSITTPPLAKIIAVQTLDSTASTTLHYDPNNASTYFFFNVPANYTEPFYTIPILIIDTLNNTWQDTVRFPVQQFLTQPYTSPVTHSAGQATGNFYIVVGGWAAVKDHSYQIQGVDSINAARDPGITLVDMTLNSVLFSNHALPDSLGHTMSVTDGFKIVRGTTRGLTAGRGMIAWNVPSGTRRFSPVGGFAGIGLEGFGNPSDPTLYNPSLGTIGWAGNLAYGGIGTTVRLPSRTHDVLLRLAAVHHDSLWNPLLTPSDSNFSRGYRYLRNLGNNGSTPPSFIPWILNGATGFPYQEFNYSVPFSAWDMSQNPPVRLAVGLIENDSSGGLVDGRYWPPTASANVGINDNSIAREFALIFASPYSTVDDSTYHVNLQNNSSLAIMWVIACSRRAEVDWASNDQFLIGAAHFPGTGDTWSFNPTVIAGVGQTSALPRKFALMQNYPNPFNPSTTIRYELPSASKVVIRVYNLLGQVITTLVDEQKQAGVYTVDWNAAMISSGVYFYRTEAVSANKRFVDVKKMILLK